MNFPTHFIAATTEYSTLSRHVPAPYVRKGFPLDKAPAKAELIITGLGFYELYLNGKHITKGQLAPYISNPDDLIYYDRYDVIGELTAGENVIGICLGNGFQNYMGGYHWFFDQAPWRSAPVMALRLDIVFCDGEILSVKSDETFRTFPAPILFDDLLIGEEYDARMEIPGWNLPGFDDRSWKNCLRVQSPRGKPCLCAADPIIVVREIAPVSVVETEDGFLYDFGVNLSGLFRLKIDGKRGQLLSFICGEVLTDGKLVPIAACLDPRDYDVNPRGLPMQRVTYICKGEENETYTPTFTYHGFQYVLAKGMTKEQATSGALTYLVMYSDLKEVGGFSCSNEILNALQQMTRNSTLSNFHYFPTDCPHREKNGWTGDASLSAEHTLLNLKAEKSYSEWMRNIRAAQDETGRIPGIVPTAGYGYDDLDGAIYNGPTWDSILVNIPNFVYLYRGDKAIVEDNAHAIMSYLDYLSTLPGEDGLISMHLGDWHHVGRPAETPKSPLCFTGTVYAMDICRKAAFLFGVIGRPTQQQFAQELYEKFRFTARERLLDLHVMAAIGNCQTSQAMAIYYGVFDPAEKSAAFQMLLKMIHAADDHMDVGALGARVLFHVLAEFGEIDLAVNLITQPDFPSYRNWVDAGRNTLGEAFGLYYGSHNHHYWGDISHFFIRHLVGINYNPHGHGWEVDICPRFARSLDWAEGFYHAPEGEIRVSWKRTDGHISLNVRVPRSLTGMIRLERGFWFDDRTEDGKTELSTAVKKLKSGIYGIIEKTDERRLIGPC